MPNRQIPGHPLEGTTLVVFPMRPPYDAEADTEPGTLVVGNGMSVEVLAVFENWNDVKGLGMFYVHCPQTGMRSHLSPRECGMTLLHREGNEND